MTHEDLAMLRRISAGKVLPAQESPQGQERIEYLVSMGYADYDGDSVRLTRRGMDALDQPATRSSGKGRRRNIKVTFGPNANRQSDGGTSSTGCLFEILVLLVLVGLFAPENVRELVFGFILDLLDITKEFLENLFSALRS